MAWSSRWRSHRVIIPLTLLVMILMRLVWMQLRTYRPVPEPRAYLSLVSLEDWTEERCLYRGPFRTEPDDQALQPELRRWLVNPGYTVAAGSLCDSGEVTDGQLARLNLWTLAGIFLAAIITMRFLTSSWTVSLIVGTMLFSRGSLLARINQLDSHVLAMACVGLWTMFAAHFLRTGARASLGGLVGVSLIAGLIDGALLALACVFPFLLMLGAPFRKRLVTPLLVRLRASHRHQQSWLKPQDGWTGGLFDGWFGRMLSPVGWMLGFDELPASPKQRPGRADERGTLLSTLDGPFVAWVYRHRRWVRLAAGWLVVAAIGLLATVLWRGSGSLQPLISFTSPLSADLSVFSWLQQWWLQAIRPFDLHLTASLVILMVCAVQRPGDGLMSFHEATWLLLALCLSLIVGAALWDYLDAAIIAGQMAEQGAAQGSSVAAIIAPRPVFVWLEPLILSFGAAGVYHLLKVIDMRLTRKR